MWSFPEIDPVALQLGPLAIRWYGLMYLAGFVCAYFFIRYRVRQTGLPLSSEAVADLLFYAVVGVVAGGRLGYVLFYQPGHYLRHPVEIVQLWQGGMSFHGGLLGVVLAVLLFCRCRRLVVGPLADILVMAACFGLCFGRLGNFINAELWGRVTDVPWGIVFPQAGPLPRHPSQLYQAILEGPVLFSLLALIARWRRPAWTVFFSFVAFYALFRFLVEFFRQPDAHLGLLGGGLSLGQWLSLPMLLLGLAGVVWSLRRGQVS
ncbi:prolipoprotein diacylglyceryl transferase [Desulfuromonas thiophila]|uniref:Phosphatidylglycerol--prolipoprotein diacylglyceryl transferase n=1 Tax=Desulfuromonas thiophila TaxID=57664 RepID=A0A1G7D1L3_9BACT|nr:prolipoprotein diacylglyceryl transferase [Desulfuromonas thiophila]SDE44806.1 phosphatidylglycerol:prolipoprotein diacylglycerol transferase [Desulfuromonas thiophila]